MWGAFELVREREREREKSFTVPDSRNEILEAELLSRYSRFNIFAEFFET